MLYKDTDLSLSETVTQNSVIDYYGIITKAGGEVYIYGFVTTSSGDKYVGYIPSSAVYDFSVPALKIEDEKESVVISSEKESFATVDNSLGNNLQLVIIIAVSAVAISIVYLLFRPTPVKARDEAVSLYDYDDE